MIKILINNEEVVSNSNLQIKEEMLSTSSTILKNCYPKVWEEDKDYVSRYYYPKDYSKCKIYNLPRENTTQEQTGTNLSFETYVGKSTLEDIKFYGNTLQDGTPTPDTPVEIQNVTGLQNVTISNGDNTESNTYEVNLGKNLLDYQTTFATPTNSTVDSDGWITASYDNTSGSSNAYANYYTKIPDGVKIKPNTTYYVYLEVKNVSYSGTSTGNYINVTNVNASYISQTGISLVKLTDLSNNSIYKYEITTKSDLSGISGLLRTFVGIQAGYSVSLTYRLTLSESNIDVSNFTYSPYFTPIELNKIGDYEDSIKKSSGKNLLNANEIYSYTIYTSSTIVRPVANRYAYLIPVKSNTTYTFSRSSTGTSSLNYIALLDNFVDGDNTYTTAYNIGSDLTYTVTTENTTNYIMVLFGSGTSVNMQLEQNSQATSYEPYGKVWYIEKNTRRLELAIKDMNNSENYPGWKNQTQLKEDYPNPSSSAFSVSTEYVNNISQYPDGGISINMSRNNATLYLTKAHFGSDYTQTYWKTNYPNLVFSMIYGIQTPEITEITNEELINQLESLNIELYEGQTNFIINGSLPMPTYIKIYTNFEELIFCGFTKNTGNVSLNPRQFHGVDLQILDFKDLLSTGETLNYVIANKTITEAINQVVNSISDYGFVVGNIEILNPNEMIGAYSTLNKTAYDVFQYFADITQSRWTTRMVDENTIAIDFYDPSLMPTGVDIDKTKIIDMSFNYSTNDYRNKQIMTSDEVYANITQTETIIADGYATSFMCQNKIGIITSITLNGEEKTFATKSEEQLGITADFVYKPGDTTFVSNNSIGAGGIIVITYYPIVKGREIVLNNIESNRIENQINRNGTISRYENRNDTTSSQELQKIGQSYIKYKGKAEINLKIQSELNTWEVGQIVSYNAPLSELSTTYMVKSKEINMYLNAKKIFYTYNLTSNYNSENAINYFDNQRAKNQGNIGEGETITRNIDLESTALIKFYDTEINEIQVSNPTSLDFALDGVLI